MQTILIPVKTLRKNHIKGCIIAEWIRITKDDSDANAAKTLICPTLEIMLGMVAAPMKYPTKYPDIINPVAVKLNSSWTALTPSS